MWELFGATEEPGWMVEWSETHEDPRWMQGLTETLQDTGWMQRELSGTLHEPRWM